MIDVTTLNAQLGKSISAICPNGYTSSHENHCAHFISHMLGYDFGANCQGLTKGKGPGANVRVHEVFARCRQVGKGANRPIVLIQCLVFNTQAGNVTLSSKTMVNVRKKHVGIFCGGRIWHYSNTQQKVVSVSPEEFSRHYPGSGYALFYGTFPA